jgi:glutaredoxin-like protein NrdH
MLLNGYKWVENDANLYYFKKLNHPHHSAYERTAFMQKPPVKIFSLSTCGHCRSTKRFLDESGITYDCVDVDQLQGEERKSVIEDVKKLNPKCSFPTLVIGEKVIVGFKEDLIKEALGL